METLSFCFSFSSLSLRSVFKSPLFAITDAGHCQSPSIRHYRCRPLSISFGPYGIATTRNAISKVGQYAIEFCYRQSCNHVRSRPTSLPTTSRKCCASNVLLGHHNFQAQRIHQ
ncbi:hypothetical protein HN51_014409 [Arachis hypogaea]